MAKGEERNAMIPLTIGWREYIALPEWGVTALKTKADTGARTSAIDVANLEISDDGWAKFDLILDRRRPGHHVTIETRLARNAVVRSSLGAKQTRPVIRTTLQLGPVEKVIEVGLVCRRQMLCRMLLGRAALSPEFIVDPSRRYCLGRPSKRRGGRRKPRETS